MTGALHDISGSDSDGPHRGQLQMPADRARTSGTTLAGLRARYEALEEQRRAAELAREQALEAARLAAIRTVDGEAFPPHVHPDDRHRVFVPTSAGYVLFERPGSSPAPGDEVALASGERFTVMRVGPSPLPGEPHACAYLERIGPICGPLALS